MAEPHAHSQPIQTYGPAPHNRNIWPSPTPTANQYKHMAQRRIIETYGHTIAGRRSFVCASGRFFCLSWWLWSTHYCPRFYPSQGRNLDRVFCSMCTAVPPVEPQHRVPEPVPSLETHLKSE